MIVAGIGHNGGPDLTGLSWRSHCWKKARTSLLPTLPIEVVRLRVRRAAELGLEYKTYAGIRASTGHDLVAFLFSSNALRVLRKNQPLPDDRVSKLSGVLADRIGLATRPLTPTELAQAAPVLTEVFAAPNHFSSFAEAARVLRDATKRYPGDTVLLVGDHPLEAEWCAAGRLAGYLPADRYFGTEAKIL